MYAELSDSKNLPQIFYYVFKHDSLAVGGNFNFDGSGTPL